MSSGETIEASNTPLHLYTPLSLSDILENLDREKPHVTEDDEPGTGAIPIVNPRARERQIDNLPSAQAPQKKDSNAEGSHCTTEKSDVAQRIPIIDNVRAVLIFLLVIHAAIIEVISSNAERLGNIRATHPRLIMFASFFIAFHKACVIPLLFFISGISSYIAMASQYRNAPKFIINKCVVGIWFGVSILVLAQLVRWTFFRNSPPNSRFYFLNKFVAVDESYYATENGKMEMMYGPLRYMIVLTIFDCVYAVARDCNRYRTVTRRFSDSKKALTLTMVGVILSFFQLVQFVFIPPHAMPNNPSLLHRAVHLITNFQNDTFPFLCVLAYAMGINITTVGSFYQSKNSVISVRHSIMGLVWRVGFLVMALYMLYFHLFPSHFANIFLDPLGKVNFDRNIQPRVYGHNSSTNIRAAAVSYVLWSMTAFGILFDLIAPLILHQVQSAQPSSTDFSLPPRRLKLNTLLMHPKWFTAMYFSSLYAATQIWLGVLKINHHHLVTSIVLSSITGVWFTESLGTGFLVAWCELIAVLETVWRRIRREEIRKNRDAHLAMKLRVAGTKITSSGG